MKISKYLTGGLRAKANFMSFFVTMLPFLWEKLYISINQVIVEVFGEKANILDVGI